jgi:hypothetical protein
MYSLEALKELAREHPEKYYVEGDKLLLKETRPTKRALDEGDSPAPQALSQSEVLSTEKADSNFALRQ